MRVWGLSRRLCGIVVGLSELFIGMEVVSGPRVSVLVVVTVVVTRVCTGSMRRVFVPTEASTFIVTAKGAVITLMDEDTSSRVATDETTPFGLVESRVVWRVARFVVVCVWSSWISFADGVGRLALRMGRAAERTEACVLGRGRGVEGAIDGMLLRLCLLSSRVRSARVGDLEGGGRVGLMGVLGGVQKPWPFGVWLHTWLGGHWTGSSLP